MTLPMNGDSLVLLHNPRCSKSRQAKSLLEERGVAFTEHLYLEAPLSRCELAELRIRLGRGPDEWIRKGEAAFADAGLSRDSDEDALLDAMASHAILIERPILVRHDRAIVGRPPEDILELAGA
jgi:arsenate reductase